MLGAMLVSLLNMLLIYALPLWLALAGFLCVSVYTRRTGETLTVGAGARMGWITGLFSYLVFAFLVTLSFFQQVRSGELYQSMQKVPLYGANPAELRQLLSNPVLLGLSVLFSLVVFLLFFAGFSIAGGALGAKTLKKG